MRVSSRLSSSKRAEAKRLKKMQKELANADASGDGKVDAEELKQIVDGDQE